MCVHFKGEIIQSVLITSSLHPHAADPPQHGVRSDFTEPGEAEMVTCVCSCVCSCVLTPVLGPLQSVMQELQSEEDDEDSEDNDDDMDSDADRPAHAHLTHHQRRSVAAASCVDEVLQSSVYTWRGAASVWRSAAGVFSRTQ